MAKESHGNIEFLNGEVFGFELFFKECFAKYSAFASRFVDDVFIREDIVQEAFIAAWASRSRQFESELVLHSFMYKMIRNKCIDYLRHEKVKERFSSKWSSEQEVEEYSMQAIIDEESHFLIHKAIKALTPQVQAVIKLHLEGKKNKEIAEELGISEATVKFHKSVAYRQLYHSLEFLILFMRVLK